MGRGGSREHRPRKDSGSHKSRTGLTRRAFLKLSGSATIGATAGCGSTQETNRTTSNAPGAGTDTSPSETHPAEEDSRSTDESTPPRQHYVSEYRNIQRAIFSASVGDTVLVDGVYEVNEPIQLKSNIVLRGHGKKREIRYIKPKNVEGDDVSFIEAENVDNVVIDGLTIHGGDARRTIGSGSPHRVEKFIVRNCTIRGGGNGISFVGDESPKIRDITVQDCEIAGASHHGIIIGTNSEEKNFGYCENVVITDNHVHDVQKWMGITLAGKRWAPCRDSRIVGNVVDASMQTVVKSDASKKNDSWLNHGILLESEVVNTLVRDNKVINVQKNGIGCFGGPHDNTFRNNDVIKCRAGAALNRFGHLDYPRNNIFERNKFRNPRDWAVYNRETGTGNIFRDNLFIGEHSIYDKDSAKFVHNSFK